MSLLPAIIIANHGAGLLLWRSFTIDEVEVNRVMIEADKSANTLANGFHERRTWIRFWHGLGCLVVGGVPAAAFAGWAAIGWSCAALGVLLGGYFLRTFSPMLNAALKLAYKPRFYVSFSATASLLDRVARWLASTKLALKLVKADTQERRASVVFQGLLNVSIVLTLVVYAGLAVHLWRLV